jgi:hypothetical protein
MIRCLALPRVRTAVFLHTGRGCLWASRHSPRPLFLEGETFLQKPGRLAPRGVQVRLALTTNEIVTVAV